MSNSAKPKPEILAVIPARGGSKSVPRKNVRDVAGKPLIAHTIEAALKSKVDRVVVSTDDPEIARVAKEYGAEVPFMRPAELARDEVVTERPIMHAVQFVEEHGYRPDIVVQLFPTNPLRTVRDIDLTIQKLIETGADAVITVNPVTEHPNWMLKLDGDRVRRISAKPIGQRQDQEKLYLLNAAVIATKRDVMMNEEDIFKKDCRAIVIDRERAVDVNTEFDVVVADALLRRNAR